AAVAEAAGGEQRGDALRFADDAEAEAPAVAGGEARLELTRLDRAHLADRLGLEIALAVKLAVVEQHLAEAGVVEGGREQAAVGRGEAIAARGGFAVENTQLNRLQLALVRAAIRAGQTRQLILAEVERRVLHSQRAEEPLVGEVGERRAGNDLDDARRGVDA